MSDIIGAIKPLRVSKAVKVKLYTKLINAFENNDADTLYECVGNDKAYDEAWEKMYPASDEDDPDCE